MQHREVPRLWGEARSPGPRLRPLLPAARLQPLPLTSIQPLPQPRDWRNRRPPFPSVPSEAVARPPHAPHWRMCRLRTCGTGTSCCAVSFVGRSMRLHRSRIVPPTPSTCLVPFGVLTLRLYAHRCVKGSCRMPAGRNRWRATVPPTSFWRRSSRSRGSPGNGKEWRKQSINGPWKRSVFAVCRSSRSLFEDRSRQVFVSTETNCAVRSVRSVYAVCTRPVQTGLCAK